MSEISPGSSWEAYKIAHFTPEEIDASKKRVAKISKNINSRIAAEEIAMQVALESAAEDRSRLKALKKLMVKVHRRDVEAIKTVLEMMVLSRE